MTNKILLLKKIACAAALVLLMAGSTQASLVYSTDFNDGVDPFPYSGGGNGSVFVLGGDSPNVVAEQWFGSNNGAGIGGGDLTFNVSADNRYRASGFWLDTAELMLAEGQVTVEIDVMDFVAGTNGAEFFFQPYAATGVDETNSVSLILHNGASGFGGSPTANPDDGTATINAIGDRQAITGDGTDLPFTFQFNGTDQFIGLVFAALNPNTGAGNNPIGGSVNIDNLTVNAAVVGVPEPSSITYAAVCGLVGLRRRRLNVVN